MKPEFDRNRLKGHWIHLFWRFYKCDFGSSYDFIPLIFGICWKRDMKLRHKIGSELDELRIYCFKNISESTQKTYILKEIQRMECELYGKDIF